MAKKDNFVAFKVDDEFKAWLMAASFSLDMSCSEFIREVLLEGYPILKAKRESACLEKDSRLTV